MLTAIEGTIRGSSVVLEPADITPYEGRRVVVTILEDSAWPGAGGAAGRRGGLGAIRDGLDAARRGEVGGAREALGAIRAKYGI